MKLETMWTMLVTMFGILGGISGIVAITRIFFPKFFDKNVDPYFFRYAPTVAEIDDKIDALLVHLPDNKVLQTLDGFTEYLQKELKEMGYKLTSEDAKRVIGRVEAQLYRNGGVRLIPQKEGRYKINYKTKL